MDEQGKGSGEKPGSLPGARGVRGLLEDDKEGQARCHRGQLSIVVAGCFPMPLCTDTQRDSAMCREEGAG